MRKNEAGAISSDPYCILWDMNAIKEKRGHARTYPFSRAGSFETPVLVKKGFFPTLAILPRRMCKV